MFADVNGDAQLDLLVCVQGDGVLCFLNAGNGRFTDATAGARTATKFAATTLALADVDGNGTLDLYVANNRTEDIRDRGKVDLQSLNGRLVVPPALRDRLVIINGQVQEHGEPDSALPQQRQGTVRARVVDRRTLSRRAGAAPHRSAKGLGAECDLSRRE